jgi:hypothetical protein
MRSESVRMAWEWRIVTVFRLDVPNKEIFGKEEVMLWESQVMELRIIERDEELRLHWNMGNCQMGQEGNWGKGGEMERVEEEIYLKMIFQSKSVSWMNFERDIGGVSLRADQNK